MKYKKPFTRYLSNVKDDGYKFLQQHYYYFTSISKLLAAAQKDMSSDQFNEGLKHLVTSFSPEKDISTSLGSMQLETASRYSWPKRKHRENTETPRSIFPRHTFSTADKEEAQTNLTYTYEPMDEDENEVVS